MFRCAKLVLVIISLVVVNQSRADAELYSSNQWEAQIKSWQENGNPPEFEIIRETMEGLAASTSIIPARETYLQILRQLQGGLPWIEMDEIRSMFIYWLESARSIAVESEDLSWINYHLARLLEEDAAKDFDPDRWIRSYQTAVFLDGLNPMEKRYAFKRKADLLALYGHQQFDSRGAVIRRPDYASAVEIYREILESDKELDSEIKERVEIRLNQIMEPRLEWLSQRSFFPDTEVQLTLRSQNLDEVGVKIFRLNDYNDLELGEDGAIRVSNSVIAGGAVQSFTYTPSPDLPYYPSEDNWDLGVQPAGIYWLRASAGEIVDESILLVTDLAILAHYSDHGLHIQGVDVDSGKPVEDLNWRLIAPGSAGDALDISGSGVVEHLAKIEIDLSGYPLVWLMVDSGGMPALLWANPVDLAEQTLTWLVETNRPTAKFGEQIQWKAQLDHNRSRSYSKLDWSKPILSRWQAPDGTVFDAQKHDSGRFKTLTGKITPDALHGEGIYSLRFEGKSLDGSTLVSMEIPVIYAGGSPSGIIQAQYSWDTPELDLLSIWILERQGISGSLSLKTPAGNPVTGAMVTISLYPAGEPSPVITETSLQSDSEGRVALSWNNFPEDLLPGIYRIETLVQSGDATIVCQDYWIEVRALSIAPEISVDQQIYNPGDIVQLNLELNSIDTLEAPIQGILIVHREQWQRTYVHRKRGSEISEEVWLALPERSLLARSQSDYRVGAEGYYTEEILRLETEADKGPIHFDIPAAEEGFYRVSWVGVGSSGKSVQAETEFRVYRPESLRRGIRFPELNIIVNESPLSITIPNRLLLTAPHVNASFLFTGGTNGPEIRRFSISVSGDALITFRLPETRHDWAWLELNTFYQGEWLSKNVLAPLSQPESTLVVDADLPERNFHPGENLHFGLKVTDVSGEPVEAEIHVEILPVAGMNITNAFAQYRQEQLFSMTMPWMTWSSVSNFPFKDNSVQSELSVLPFSDMPESEVRKIAQWQNYRNRISEPSIWLSNIYTDESGVGEMQFSLPDYSSEWMIKIHAKDRNYREGTFEQAISTYSAIELEWSAPSLLYLGDEIHHPVQISNQSGHNVKGHLTQRLSIDSQLEDQEEWSLELSPGEELSLPLQLSPLSSGCLQVDLYFNADLVQQHAQQTLEVVDARFIGPFWRLEKPAENAGQVIASKTVHGLKELLKFSLDYSVNQKSLHLEEIVGSLFRDDFLATTMYVKTDDATKLGDWTFLKKKQNENGGWSRSPGTQSDPWLTALILWMASERGGEKEDELSGMAARAHSYLVERLFETSGDPLLIAWILHANTYYHTYFGDGRLERMEARAYLSLMREINNLGVEVEALLLMVSLLQQFEEEAGLLLARLQRSVVKDDIQWTTARHGYENLFPLLSLRALLWAHAEWGGANRLAELLPGALVSHHEDNLTTFLAQVIAVEYLLSRPQTGSDKESVFNLSLQNHLLNPSDPLEFAELEFKRKILTPTLLKGFVERNEAWNPGTALQIGDSLEMGVRLAFDEKPGQKTIRIRTPAGLTNGNIINSVRWLSDDVAHKIITGKYHTDIIFQSVEPCQIGFRCSLRAETAGKFTIPALLLFSERSSIPEVISDSMSIEVKHPD